MDPSSESYLGLTLASDYASQADGAKGYLGVRPKAIVEQFFRGDVQAVIIAGRSRSAEPIRRRSSSKRGSLRIPENTGSTSSRIRYATNAAAVTPRSPAPSA